MKTSSRWVWVWVFNVRNEHGRGFDFEADVGVGVGVGYKTVSTNLGIFVPGLGHILLRSMFPPLVKVLCVCVCVCVSVGVGLGVCFATTLQKACSLLCVQAPSRMDLGPLVEIVVGHDMAGGAINAWHLEQVDVIDPSGKV